MTTDTSELGLEALIVKQMTSARGGWQPSNPKDYDREYAVDLVQLYRFLRATQPALALAVDLDHEGPTRQKFLARLQGEIAKRGVIDVLRHGVKHGPHHLDLFYGTPSPGNPKAAERYAANRFTVTRQLRYSRDETQLALDLCIFINGLPVATFELKNNLTKQTVEDAVEQYRRDRDPRELLFQFGRCMAHFAVDDQEVRFCTQLRGKASWFLPFNQGWQDGAGNPPNPDGLKTDYLWRRVLLPAGLTDILENYAQIVTEKDPKTGKKKSKQIFPRYHQLDVVRRLLADSAEHGAGRRYLIEHSAGSGKSNSIAWLAHQQIGLEHDGKTAFDSIIVVTDRVVLDKQIRDAIKQFAQVGATVAHAERSGDLRQFIESGKKIIITTVQKFPFILDDIGSEHRQRKFAIIIDEAHSSQGGRATAAMSRALSEVGAEDAEETVEDKVNRIMAARKMLPNASYYAFTATPKNKTLEIFGEPYQDGEVAKHRPFHSYTMKQAIEERFILDVLKSYTSVNSYYKLVKTVEADPEFDIRRANKKLRRYVEGHDHAIRLKAEIMIDHFHEQVAGLKKIGGQARAMVVTGSIERTIQYFFAFRNYLAERKSPYQAIVAFSGEHDYKGTKVTEASLNGFPSSQITDRIQEDPYRFLLCADKFQTGYDEPLLHTMYVDKPLSGIKAVQTLSRLKARTALSHKQGLPGWRATLHLGVTAEGSHRQLQLLGRLAAAIRVAQGPGVHVGFRGARTSTLDASRLPFRRPLLVNVGELKGLVGWPLGTTELLPVERIPSRLLPPATRVPNTGRIVGEATYPGRERPLALAYRDALQHLHVIGPTGVGKSTLLLNLMVQDMAAGRSLVLIEPKGDLVHDVLARVPDQRRDDVVVIDPTDSAPIGLNPLATPGVEGGVKTDQLLAIFKGLFPESWGPRLQDILTAGLLTLTRTPGMSLPALPLLFTDATFRSRLLGRLHDPLALGPFWAWFEELSAAERALVLAPVMNRLRAFLLRDRLRRVLGQTKPRFDLRQVFTERKILLVNANAGALGSESASLLGSLVVSQLWQTALGRSRIAPEQRHPVMVVIDEFQNYLHLPTDLADVLAQARGLGVGLTLAHQHLGQLPLDVKAAVLANARSRVLFAANHDDASVLVKGDDRLQPTDVANLGRFEAYASLLADNQPTPYTSILTLPAPPPVRPAREVLARSRQQWGVPAGVVDTELEALARGVDDRHQAQSTTSSDAFGVTKRAGKRGSQRGEAMS